MVCIRFGRMVSFISTVSAPPTPRSSAVTGSPARLLPITIRPSRSRMSPNEVARASTAMISLATAMSNPVTRSAPFSSGPCPIVICRSIRSLVSTTLRHVMLSGSMSSRAKRLFSSAVRVFGSVF